MAIHRSGFVNIIGNPNTGKSTLMNELIGERLSIISSKAQTTRHRIHGILNGDDYQIVFSDTPGILKPHYKLQEKMLSFVDESLIDADVFLYMVEIGEKAFENDYIIKIKNLNRPTLLLLNKIDLSANDEVAVKVSEWEKILPKAEIIPLSALHKANTAYVKERIIANLPEGPAYYDKDQLTDKPEKFFVSEIIREKILMYYDKEIPYSTEVVVEEFKEDENIIRIRAIIYCTRESQKGILIGHNGVAIKKTGTQARKELEAFFQKKIFIELIVKVDKDWRDNDTKLKRYGYSM
ncbi:MAG: GTPase Era [Bacteroidota bacterium]|nr:GTPase Era [Bacteroidota bacterium]